MYNIHISSYLYIFINKFVVLGANLSNMHLCWTPIPWGPCCPCAVAGRRRGLRSCHSDFVTWQRQQMGIIIYCAHQYIHIYIYNIIYIYIIYIYTYALYIIYIYIYIITTPLKLLFRGGTIPKRKIHFQGPPLKCKIGRWTSPRCRFCGEGLQNTFKM